jgi:hypothetical protein
LRISVDLFVFNGRYSGAAEHLLFGVLRGFPLM